jgi:hypothetical protein
MSGICVTCSQLRNVATLTPIISANSDCDTPSFARTARTSAGRNAFVREGFNVPRRIVVNVRRGFDEDRERHLSSRVGSREGATCRVSTSAWNGSSGAFRS